MNDLKQRIEPEELYFSSQQLKGIIDEYELQTAVAGAQYAKSVYCYRLISDLYEHGYLTSQATMDFMVALDQTISYDTPYRDMWQQYSLTRIGDYLNTMLRVDRLAARRIAEEVDRILYRPTPPPREPGLIERLITAWRSTK